MPNACEECARLFREVAMAFIDGDWERLHELHKQERDHQQKTHLLADWRALWPEAELACE